MAEKLVLEFQDAAGTSRKWTFNYADGEVAASAVKALANGMITNGTIFAHPPVKAIGAAIVKTSERYIDIG